jgi:hypothetical protein
LSWLVLAATADDVDVAGGRYGRASRQTTARPPMRTTWRPVRETMAGTTWTSADIDVPNRSTTGRSRYQTRCHCSGGVNPPGSPARGRDPVPGRVRRTTAAPTANFRLSS